MYPLPPAPLFGVREVEARGYLKRLQSAPRVLQVPACGAASVYALHHVHHTPHMRHKTSQGKPSLIVPSSPTLSETARKTPNL
eukprot:2188095-Prymnesium_polylepis.1